jgi:competence protein ComFC
VVAATISVKKMADLSRKLDWLKRYSITAAHGLGHLLWPGVCVNCDSNLAETASALCSDCWGELASVCTPDYCHCCGRDVSKYGVYDDACPNCRSEEIHFDAIARAGIYDDALRNVILAFKYGKTELDLVLAGLINSALQVSGFSGDIDLIVPVPLHWRRRLTRGYNQSHILAKKLIHPAKINTDLVRIRYTKPQPGMLTPAARAKNVAGAFAVRYKHPFAGRRICLVDDVKTTGATLNECANTLKQAGASKIFALVLAVAGQNV